MYSHVLYAYDTCGLAVWYAFHRGKAIKSLEFGNLDYAIASFINDKDSEKVFDLINKNHTIVYQSPVKKNKFSKNDSFFIVFSKGKK